MAGRVRKRLQHAWNVFTKDKPVVYSPGSSYYATRNTSRYTSYGSGERTTLASIFNHMAVDVASVQIKHVRLDDDGFYAETINSPLNWCFNVSANLDQAARMFLQDISMTLFTEGVAAIVPTRASNNPRITEAYDVYAMRCGKIVNWGPDWVTVDVYNEDTGMRENVSMLKRNVAIIENPFYPIMNEPNSTLQRLIRKLALLDSSDEKAGSGKLDLIIQLPYVIKSENKRAEAQRRLQELESQLEGSQHGIAYADGTENVIQLNRPVENTLLVQIEYLTKQLFDEVGLTPEILNGTASSDVMNNYMNRTIEPILDAIVQELKRKFLSKTAITQGQSIEYYADPFKLLPYSELAEIVDKFTRNEIMTRNEIRPKFGLPRSKDPRADQLYNSNMPDPKTDQTTDGSDDLSEST